MSKNVRVRFAPSPTGNLHIGGARTALYNWAFAKKMEGTFVLRIDDTDPERSTEENTQAIFDALKWLGLLWDEGPEVGGEHGPYFQTQRSENYRAALGALKEKGAVYPCFCSPEELAQKREANRAAGTFSGYDRTCRSIDPSEAQKRINAGEPFVWRLRVPDDHGDIVVKDAIRGETAFPVKAMDDFVLVRTDDTPTYNFASVVDDIDMEITHVIRGDDHLSNTPRQMLVFEALGADIPTFAHLSMIWGPDGKRLSKRHGATSVQAYAAEGYVPEALNNYLALLGWSLDGETTLFSLDTLAENFSLERVSKNPAIFDSEKLEWMNGVYLREMGADEFVRRIEPLLIAEHLIGPGNIECDHDWFIQMAPLVSERIKRLDEVVPMIRFFFVDHVEIDEKARAKVLDKDPEVTQAIVEALLGALEPCEWTPEAIEEALRAVPEQTGQKPKQVFQTARAAVTGTLVSPPLWESLFLLGKERTLERLRDIL